MVSMTEQRSVGSIIKKYLTVFDAPLLLILCLICIVSAFIMYSAGMDADGRFAAHMRNFMIAFFVMWIAASVPPQTLMRFAVPLYTVGITLLIAVALFGIVKKGARRWVNIGVVIQPSEIMKIAVPLMLAWYFQKKESFIRWQDFVVAALLLIIPFVLIAKQPDLGTATLVGAAGFYVIFLAGLSWKVLISLAIAGAASLPVVWSMLHDYQRHRVMTLIDPTTDPLGKGFHIIQSMIAIGSGGLTGKGWTKGTPLIRKNSA
jgi:rod shape determining protein RodA